MGYLSTDGFRYVWSKIKAGFVAKVDGMGLSSNDYTDDEKTKLAGISAGANKTVIVDNLTTQNSSAALSAKQGKVLKDLVDSKGTGNGDMLKSVYDTDGDGVVDNAEKVNGKTVEANVPADAKFTDTTYDAFTTTEKGLVPAPTADKDDHDYYLAGSGEWRQLWGEVSRDASKVYVSVYAGGSNNVMESSGAINAATSSYAGIMTAAQAGKLDALPTNATLESTYAKKTDITGVYKYKGSVASESALPTTGQIKGDVYDIQTASSYGGPGMNVVWDGTKWDALGEVFSIDEITNEEIDEICV